MEPRSPDFIGIGAQKAATTWLYTQLQQHHRLWLAPLKEIHYFDQDISLFSSPGLGDAPADRSPRSIHREKIEDGSYLQEIEAASGESERNWLRQFYSLPRDEQWYRTLFAAAPRDALVGEITPRYAICDDAMVAHMRDVAPHAKLLFVLREPVARFWSQCRMKFDADQLAQNDPAIAQFFKSHLGFPRGVYSTTLRRFARYVEPSSMLVIFHDAIEQQPGAVLTAIWEFLGVEPIACENLSIAARVNASRPQLEMPEQLRAEVAAAYEPELRTLSRVFGSYAGSWTGQPSTLCGTIRLQQKHVVELENNG